MLAWGWALVQFTRTTFFVSRKGEGFQILKDLQPKILKHFALKITSFPKIYP
jgi:hypothetical protein